MKNFMFLKFQPLCNPTIWQTVVSLVNQTKGVNLSQGDPNFGPQSFFIKNMQKATLQSFTQQDDSNGISQLRKSIVKYHQIQYGKLNQSTNVAVTCGAGAALYSIFAAFVNPNDQILLFEPAFDYYRYFATIFSAKSQNIKIFSKDKKSRSQVKQMLEINKIQAKDWQIDWQELQKKLTDKVKLIIINSPQNPSGKIFAQNEIDRICQIALKLPNLIILEDCAYEGFMLDEYKGKFLPKLIHSKYYPQLKQRSASVYSGGKLLQATGIRCGWVIGPKNMIELISEVHQKVQKQVPKMIQKSVAYCLQEIVSQNYSYLEKQSTRLEKHRQQLLRVLSECKYNIKIMIPKAGYFILVDISQVDILQKYFTFRLQNGQKRNPRDLAFCYQMAFQDGVIMLPCLTFFGSQNKQQNLIRFALCKTINAIKSAGQKLKQ